MCFFLIGFLWNIRFFFHNWGANINIESKIIFSNWISKNLWVSSIWRTEIFWLYCETLNYTNVYNDRMSNRERKWERGKREGEIEEFHSKFHLSDLLLMTTVYFGEATPFSLTRHFDNCQTPDKRINLCHLMSFLVTCESSFTYFCVVKRISFPFSIFKETRFFATFDRPLRG